MDIYLLNMPRESNNWLLTLYGSYAAGCCFLFRYLEELQAILYRSRSSLNLWSPVARSCMKRKGITLYTLSSCSNLTILEQLFSRIARESKKNSMQCHVCTSPRWRGLVHLTFLFLMCPTVPKSARLFYLRCSLEDILLWYNKLCIYSSVGVVILSADKRWTRWGCRPRCVLTLHLKHFCSHKAKLCGMLQHPLCCSLQIKTSVNLYLIILVRVHSLSTARQLLVLGPRQSTDRSCVHHFILLW